MILFEVIGVAVVVVVMLAWLAVITGHLKINVKTTIERD